MHAWSKKNGESQDKQEVTDRDKNKTNPQSTASRTGVAAGRRCRR